MKSLRSLKTLVTMTFLSGLETRPIRRPRKELPVESYRLRDSGAVGAWVGGSIVGAGIGVVQDGLAAPHRFDVFAEHADDAAGSGCAQ
jgi:hypothetical protein